MPRNVITLTCPHCRRAVAKTNTGALMDALQRCPHCDLRLAAGRKVSAHREPETAAAPIGKDAVLEDAKSRLKAWFQRLEAGDPYHELGLHPRATLEELKRRFHELAMEHHPDRGGDPEKMRRLVTAFERAQSLARARQGAGKEEARPVVAPVPARRFRGR